MTDPHKDIRVRLPDNIISPTGGHLSAYDLARMGGVPRHLADKAGKIEVHIHQDASPAVGAHGDDILRKFVPYFVVSVMGMILLGSLIALLGLVIPMIMGLIVTLVGSIVSLVMSLVVTIIACVVAAVGIGYLQTVNAKQGGKTTGKVIRGRR